MLSFVLFFVFASVSLTLLMSRSIAADLSFLNSFTTSRQAFLTAESSLEDVVFRMMTSSSYGSLSLLSLLPGNASTTVSYDTNEDTFIVTSVAKVGKANRTVVATLVPGEGSAFNYGLQTGNGGFRLVNSASITGNAFSNGTIVGQGSSIIRGDVISAGPSGRIERITATGTAWANTLTDSVIYGDAHYNVVGIPSTVNGTRYTPAAIVDPQILPIEDAKVEEWKDEIQNSGTIIPASSCTAGWYVITASTNLGDIKIECNLRIRKTGGSTVITLTGPVWVTGNIELEQGPELRVVPSLGRKSVQIIADNPADRITSSKISIRNSTQFFGSGHSMSFIMMLSQNNSAELGGTEKAIEIAQASNGALILYAGHGLVDVGNSITLKSVTGYQINIGNNSDIIYDTGLTSALFTGGPGGGYVVSNWYQE